MWTYSWFSGSGSGQVAWIERARRIVGLVKVVTPNIADDWLTLGVGFSGRGPRAGCSPRDWTSLDADLPVPPLRRGSVCLDADPGLVAAPSRRNVACAGGRRDVGPDIAAELGLRDLRRSGLPMRLGSRIERRAASLVRSRESDMASGRIEAPSALASTALSSLASEGR